MSKKIDQKILVYGIDEGVSEYEEGYIGIYYYIDYHDDSEDSDFDEIFLPLFFDSKKQVKGILIDNNTKKLSDRIYDILGNMDIYNVDDTYLDEFQCAFKVYKIAGVIIFDDYNEDEEHNSILELNDDIMCDYKKVRDKMINSHIEEFGEYYSELKQQKMLRINCIYDFSDEMYFLYEINKNFNQIDYPLENDMIQKELQKIIFNYYTNNV